MSNKTITTIFLTITLSLLPLAAGFYAADAALGDTKIECRTSDSKCFAKTYGAFTGDVRSIKSVAAR